MLIERGASAFDLAPLATVIARRARSVELPGERRTLFHIVSESLKLFRRYAIISSAVTKARMANANLDLDDVVFITKDFPRSISIEHPLCIFVRDDANALAVFEIAHHQAIAALPEREQGNAVRRAALIGDRHEIG